jgi:hypothetical protein
VVGCATQIKVFNKSDDIKDYLTTISIFPFESGGKRTKFPHYYENALLVQIMVSDGKQAARNALTSVWVVSAVRI